MNQIFGIQNWCGEKPLREAVIQLGTPTIGKFDHPSRIQVFEHSALGAAVAPHFSNTRWPLVSRDGSYALAVFGEIYLPDGSPLRAENFEDRFLFPFLEAPDAFLLTLDGAFHFALVSEHESWLATDPFGTFALHYAHTTSGFIYGTQADGIREVAGNRSLNETGLLQYLGLGQTLSGRTLFEEIARMKAGTIIYISRKGIRETRYFVPRYTENTRGVNETLAGIGNQFERSVVRRVGYPNATAALTGGFDSRATWSVLLHRQLPVVAHTHGLPKSSDFALASRISNKLRIPHETILFDAKFLKTIPSQWNDFVRITEGTISIAHAPTLLTWKRLTGRYAVLLDSYGGTFYRRQRMKVGELRIDTKKDLIPQLLRYERSPLLRSNLLSHDIRSQAEHEIEQGLRSYYDSISDTLLLGDKLDRYHFEEVDAMRDAMLANAQMQFIGVAHPFLSLSAFRLATTLPLSERRRDAAHKYIIHYSFPELERFWMDNVGFVTPYRGFSTLRYAAMAVECGIHAASKIIPAFRNLSLRKPTMDARHLLQPGLMHAKEILLTPHPIFDPIVNRSEIENALRELESGNYSSALAIIPLLTFRIFLDLFY